MLSIPSAAVLFQGASDTAVQPPPDSNMNPCQYQLRLRFQCAQGLSEIYLLNYYCHQPTLAPHVESLEDLRAACLG